MDKVKQSQTNRTRQGRKTDTRQNKRGHGKAKGNTVKQDKLWQEKARQINNRQDRRGRGQAKRNKQGKTRQDKQEI